MAEESTKQTASQAVTGVGIAALVVGIVAFISGWVAIWGVAAGIAAVVLGIIALKKSKGNKGFGITGIVLGGIAALTSIVFTIIWALAFTFVAVGSGAALNAAKSATDAINAENASVQAQIDAKKDFSKGETANFGDFDVTVKSVTRDYTSTDAYTQPSDGNEFVVVNISVKNTTDSTQSFTRYDLKLIDGSVANDASFVAEVSPSFTGGSIVAGGTAEGNIVFEAKQGATGLKLQYETTVYDTKSYQSKTLTYTLAI
jgi:hypothetical protein